MNIETHIQDVPCNIDALYKSALNGDSNSQDSPEDCYGYDEIIAFRVKTLKGKPFPWLQARMTEADKERIHQLIRDKAESDSCEPN